MELPFRLDPRPRNSFHSVSRLTVAVLSPSATFGEKIGWILYLKHVF